MSISNISEEPERKKPRISMTALFALAIISSLLMISVINPGPGGITGMATYTENNNLVLEINKEFSISTEEQLEIDKNITSLKINLATNGTGKATITLIDSQKERVVAKINLEEEISKQDKTKEKENTEEIKEKEEKEESKKSGENENPNTITGYVTFNEFDVEQETEEADMPENIELAPEQVPDISKTKEYIKEEPDEATSEVESEGISEPENADDAEEKNSLTNGEDNLDSEPDQGNNSLQDEILEEEQTENSEQNETEAETEPAEKETESYEEETDITVDENNVNETPNESEYPPTSTPDERAITKSFEGICEETCLFDSKAPYSLRIELEGSITVNIEKIIYTISSEAIENATMNLTENETKLNLTENVTINLTRNITANITFNITTNITTNITLNESLNFTENMTINITENITENMTENITVKIETIQGLARLNEPVKWEKKITVEEDNFSESNITISIPSEAQNITLIKRFKDGAATSEDIAESSLKRNLVPKDKETGLILGIQQNSEEHENTDANTEEFIEIDIFSITSDTEETLLEYYTSAPTAKEKELNANSKEIIVSSSMHYDDVLAYSDLPSEIQNPSTIKLLWIINSSENVKEAGLSQEEILAIETNGELQKEITFTPIDKDNNDLIESIEWIAPHLSDQKFIIILITKADLLDENRSYIKSIYEYVREKDNTTYILAENEHIRVTFEQNLTSDNDITIYAKPANSSLPVSIAVYEQNGVEIIAEFEEISEEKNYTVMLSSLEGTQDSFDLRVIGGPLEIDHIIDPTPIITLNMTLLDTFTSSANPYSIDGSRQFARAILNGYIYITSLTDDTLTIINVTDPTNVVGSGNITTSGPVSSLDGAYGIKVDEQRNIAYICAQVDDSVSIYNVSNKIRPVAMGSTGPAAANPYSLDGCTDVEYMDVGNQRYLAVAGATDNTITILNVTDPTIRPTNLSYLNRVAGLCLTGSVRELEYLPDKQVLIGASYVNDSISVWNISSNGTITCLTNFTTSANPFSLDGVEGFEYENSTGLLYAAASIDDTLTILNLSNIQAITGVSNITNTVLGGSSSLDLADDVAVGDVLGNRKFAYVAVKGTAAVMGRITVVNVTNPMSPQILTSFNTTNQAACKYNQTDYLEEHNGILYAMSTGDDCVYTIRVYDYTYINPSSITSRISPENPGTTSTLMGYCNATDDDSIYYNYIWYKNNTINITNTTAQAYASGIEINVANISSSSLVAGDNWTFSCQANDTLNLSSWANSSTVIIVKNIPEIAVQPLSSINPVEGLQRKVSFNFTVSDGDGNATISVPSASVTINRSGTTRSSFECSSKEINQTSINVTCNVSMQYYDPAGIWSVNVSIEDADGNYAENTTSALTYNELSAIQLSSSSLNFGLLQIGEENISREIILNNTGNVNFTFVSIKSYDLVNSSGIIGSGNFTINVTNSSFGTRLDNNTLLNITNASPHTATDYTAGNQSYFIHLDVPNIALEKLQFTSLLSWTIFADK